VKNESSVSVPEMSLSGTTAFLASTWRNTAAIFWKEFKTYFTSPMAYIIAGVFLAITGYLFVQSISTTFPEASIRGWLEPSTTVFVLWSPALTMRLLAEEQKLGTLELLMTSPIRDYEIVLGKFFAVLVILLATLSLTMFYTLMLFWFGDPDVGPVFSGYLGIILFGASTLAVGMLASSLTSNQVVAAVVSFGFLLLMVLTNQAADITTGLSAQILEGFSLSGHFDDFSRGVIDTNNIVYYFSVIATFLFLTIRNVESRRWR
jgi:ABC-2 type transport system permease protein